MTKKSADPVQLNLFVSDLLSWSPKSDAPSLGHPFFSLSKRKDTKIRKYESPDGTCAIEVTPSMKGIATIWDKDLLIFAVSTLRDALNKGERVNRNTPINITAYNMLQATERGMGGQSYLDLEKALDRLMGTTVKTNIPTGGTTKTDSFHLIENYRIIRDTKTKRMNSIEIIMNEWLWDAVVNDGKDLLTIDKTYFLLKGGVERRLYEMCRKHCGHQAGWQIGLQKLHIKSGSSSTLKEFRRMVKDVVDRDCLPGYSISLDSEKDMFIARNKLRAELILSMNDES
jgi:plasmid replication initiation protein